MIANDMTKRIRITWAWFSGMPRWRQVALAMVTTLSIVLFWIFLRAGGGKETYGDTLRNLILILAGPVGLGLALWRSITADTQARLMQRGLKDERYQKGADMLGSNTLATRIGGIYALEHLARDHPEEYHIQIMVLLCAFVQQPRGKYNQLTNDIQKALTVIGQRDQKQQDLEKKENWKLDLFRANLSDTDLKFACLTSANLQKTNLRKTNLNGADLTNAELDGAYLENTKLKDVKGLTQSMLNSTKHYYEGGTPMAGPDLEGAFCAESGKSLVWQI